MSARKPKPAAQAAGSAVARDALLRGGSGKHGDRRLRRVRTRSAQRANALREW